MLARPGDIKQFTFNKIPKLFSQWLTVDEAIIQNKQKVKNVKSKNEIEQERARKILGGKSEWGGPILYGSPEEQLDQLRGYEGRKIEEIRQRLKDQIDKSKN